MQLLNENIYYEGEIIDMFIFKKGARLNENKKTETDSNDNAAIEKLSLEIKKMNEKIDEIQKSKNILLDYYNSHPFKMSVIASLIASLIFSFVGILVNNYVIFRSPLYSNSSSTTTDVDVSQNNDSDYEPTIEERIKRLEYNVITIANATGVYIYSDLEYTKDFVEQLALTTETVDMNYYASEPPCQDSDVIAISNITGDQYTKKQLVGEKLLIPYTYNGQEVLFYGQYNEKNNWDQDCTINVYENDKLVLISETDYKNGVPSSFKQVYPEKVKSGENVWTITDRKYENNRNYGENWNYFKFNDHLKTFDFENATIDNIIYVSDFENDLKNYSLLEGYYCGEIQNSTYNDKNEKPSYMMKNDKNGYVRTIYIGDFENGDFNDHSGKAEEIVFDESVNKYFYYIGSFTKGERDSKSSEALRYITQDEIKSIIKPYNFNCELNFHDTTEND